MKTKIPKSRVLKSIALTRVDTVELHYHPNIRIGIDDIRHLFQKLYEVTEQKRLKRLIVVNPNTSLDISARSYLQEENKSKRHIIIAEAVVVNNLAQKMAVNFYLKFIKDSYPLRYFTDIESARNWLDMQDGKTG